MKIATLVSIAIFLMVGISLAGDADLVGEYQGYQEQVVDEAMGSSVMADAKLTIYGKFGEWFVGKLEFEKFNKKGKPNGLGSKNVKGQLENGVLCFYHNTRKEGGDWARLTVLPSELKGDYQRSDKKRGAMVLKKRSSSTGGEMSEEIKLLIEKILAKQDD